MWDTETAGSGLQTGFVDAEEVTRAGRLEDNAESSLVLISALSHESPIFVAGKCFQGASLAPKIPRLVN
jgi:hypothetical protein